jgi:hypothetical protein
MGKEVSVSVDKRVLSGLGMVVVVIAVLAAGLWLGRAVGTRSRAAGPSGGAPAALGTSSASSLPANAPAAPPMGGAASDAASVAGPVAQGASGASTGPSDAPPGGLVTGPANPVPIESVPVAAGQPRVWVDEVDAPGGFTYQLGEIPATTTTEHTFTIRNIGDGLLVIQDVTATCGCTTAQLEKQTLEPGETATVRVTYDPRTDGEVGVPIEKSVLIRSNDPLVPLAEFKIAAQVASA